MDRTRSMPLVAGATAGLKVDQVQHLLHGDLLAKHVEVNAGHHVLLSSVPFSKGQKRGGTGTRPGS